MPARRPDPILAELAKIRDASEKQAANGDFFVAEIKAQQERMKTMKGKVLWWGTGFFCAVVAASFGLGPLFKLILSIIGFGG